MTVEHKPIIIVGCGRVGAELAVSLCGKSHKVTVIDPNARSFERLGPEFSGRTVQGDGLDQDVLKRAGIGNANALAATSASDSVNIVVARTAQEIFKVPHVVARVYNPRRAPVYERLGLQTIASSSWAAQRIEEIVLHSGMRHLGGAGSGEVQAYEILVPAVWSGKMISEVLPPGALGTALCRGGAASLPTTETVLHENDLLQISALSQAADRLRLAVLGK